MVFSPYDEYWRKVRRISMSELLSMKRVESFRGVREEEVRLLIASIRNYSPSFVGVNLSEKTHSLVNNVVCRVVFGGNYEEKEKEYGKSRFHEILSDVQAQLGGFNVADFFPNMEWLNRVIGVKDRLEKNFQALDSFYEQVIKAHAEFETKKKSANDLVDVLLRAQKDPSHGIPITSDRIKGILTDMFIAGTDTSSALLVWIMSELVRHPKIMKKAQEEVRKAIGEKEMAEESDLHQLHYLKLVVKETLRLHPPAPLLVPRETTEKCTVGGYEIPAKTRVLVNARAIQMDPKYWENPEEFQTERFLSNPTDFRGQDFQLLPFGFGRRGCSGIHFATVLVELALANLLHCFDWELPDGMRTEDVDMEAAVGLTMHKKSPLRLVAIPKIQSCG